MTLKQYYLSMINGAMMTGDEKEIKFYEEKLNELLREEYQAKLDEVKKASK